MVVSSAQNYSKDQQKIIDIKNTSINKNKLITLRQTGQIHIYKSPHRGSYSTVIRDSLRNAALGRKVLLVQLMKGGVNQGISNQIRLCRNLVWIRSSNSFDQYKSSEINSNESISRSIKDSTIELWDFCKNQLLSEEYDQIILDEIFQAIDLGIIHSDDLIQALNTRCITGDVILTGTSISKDFLSMADQVTELRS